MATTIYIGEMIRLHQVFLKSVYGKPLKAYAGAVWPDYPMVILIFFALMDIRVMHKAMAMPFSIEMVCKLCFGTSCRLCWKSTPIHPLSNADLKTLHNQYHV